MRRAKWLKYSVLLVVLPVTLMTAQMVRSAYHHEGQDDAAMFLQVYPDRAGTKLDNCNLCHSGGRTSIPGKTERLEAASTAMTSRSTGKVNPQAVSLLIVSPRTIAPLSIPTGWITCRQAETPQP